MKIYNENNGHLAVNQQFDNIGVSCPMDSDICKFVADLGCGISQLSVVTVRHLFVQHVSVPLFHYTVLLPNYSFMSDDCDNNTHNRFMALFPGLSGWAGAKRYLLLDFMVQGKITEADTPTIRFSTTPSRLISDPPPSPPIFPPDAIPATTVLQQ